MMIEGVSAEYNEESEENFMNDIISQNQDTKNFDQIKVKNLKKKQDV